MIIFKVKQKTKITHKTKALTGGVGSTKRLCNAGVQSKFVVLIFRLRLVVWTVTRFEYPPLLMHKRW
jgi:hypothetical protein